MMKKKSVLKWTHQERVVKNETRKYPLSGVLDLQLGPSFDWYLLFVHVPEVKNEIQSHLQSTPSCL